MRSRSQEMSDRECVGSTRKNSNWKRFARSRPANRWGPRPGIGHPQRLEHSNGLRQSAKGPIWTGHTCEQGRRFCALNVADRGLIAERRYGELLKERYRATPAETGAKGNATQGKHAPASPADASPYHRALSDTCVSPRATSRRQAP